MLWGIWAAGVLALLIALWLRSGTTTPEEARRQAFLLGFDEGTIYALTASADSSWAPAAAADSLWLKWREEDLP